jgi:hypothetical protein
MVQGWIIYFNFKVIIYAICAVLSGGFCVSNQIISYYF